MAGIIFSLPVCIVQARSSPPTWSTWCLPMPPSSIWKVSSTQTLIMTIWVDRSISQGIQVTLRLPGKPYRHHISIPPSITSSGNRMLAVCTPAPKTCSLQWPSPHTWAPHKHLGTGLVRAEICLLRAKRLRIRVCVPALCFSMERTRISTIEPLVFTSAQSIASFPLATRRPASASLMLCNRAVFLSSQHRS